MLLSFFEEPTLPFDESAGFTAPSAFGSYRVLHQIGSGVLGPVFRTYDPQRDRLVAVKAFRLDVVPEQVARLADALRRLAPSVPPHPGIVAPLDGGLEGTTAFLASEYVAAETLDVALRHLAPAPLARALPILTRLAEAIDAAWAAGVGHGALHPRDIFVSVDSQDVRITGIGVAPALERIGVKAPVRRPYTAPERANGEAWDARADIYSLGAIAHELLTRRRPAGSGEQDGALTTDTSPEQRVQIRRVLSAVLAERPQHRFASARAFTEALDAVARNEDVTTIPGAIDDVAMEEQTPTVAQPALAFEAAPPIDRKEQAAETIAPAVEAPQPAVETRAIEVLAETEPTPIPAAPPALWPAAPAVAAETHESADRIVLAPQPGPPALPTPATPPEFPWSAIGAATAAALLAGIVLGYQWGQSSAAQAAAQSAVSTPGMDTDVRMPSEPLPASAPSASSDPAPVLKAAARPAKVPERGRLLVRSVPQGAMIVVDGRPRGQTPATVTDLPFGDHVVEVARSGYVPHSERVSITGATPARTLSVRLEAGVSTRPAASDAPAGTTGSVFVDSRPQGARVIIDGRYAGMTPVRVPGVPTGRREIRIERAGYQAFTSRAEVKSGEQARITAALEEK